MIWSEGTSTGPLSERQEATMKILNHIGMLVLLAGSLIACGRPQATNDGQLSGQAPGSASQTKRVTAAIMGDAPALAQALAGFGIRGVDALEHMVNAGLTVVSNK